jgi:hypothetical protein
MPRRPLLAENCGNASRGAIPSNTAARFGFGSSRRRRVRPSARTFRSRWTDTSAPGSILPRAVARRGHPGTIPSGASRRRPRGVDPEARAARAPGNDFIRRLTTSERPRPLILAPHSLGDQGGEVEDDLQLGNPQGLRRRGGGSGTAVTNDSVRETSYLRTGVKPSSIQGMWLRTWPWSEFRSGVTSTAMIAPPWMK